MNRSVLYLLVAMGQQHFTMGRLGSAPVGPGGCSRYILNTNAVHPSFQSPLTVGGDLHARHPPPPPQVHVNGDPTHIGC